MKIAIVSGGFDPLHSGHIEYFNAAKEHGEKLIVLLNSDEWLQNKKGKFFMPFEERKIIIKNLYMIDDVLDFKDDNFGSCSNGLKKIKKQYPNDQLIFCNGGDRNKKNIPEQKINGIDFKFGVGGDSKSNSSSWILKEYKYDGEDRIWGKFYNLFKDTNIKLKELIVLPKKGMSYQRHFKRNEIWFVSKGSCSVKFSNKDPNKFKFVELDKEDIFHVEKGSWHQIINNTNEACHIIEIQYGEETQEDDIERLHYFKDIKT
tara:strand:- start:3790 stop:4569 length:780 start_codon:yes stop_codon:yes gene_type:complete